MYIRWLVKIMEINMTEKKHKTPFINGDAQQNTHALANRITSFFFEGEGNKKKHKNEKERLLRSLMEFQIKHPNSPWAEEVMNKLLVGYIRWMSHIGLHEDYLNFEAYKQGKSDKALEVSGNHISASIMK